jgi:F-type H+-transporting ATPase subunit b
MIKMRLKHLYEVVSLATLTVATYLGLGTASWSGSDAPLLSLNNTNFVVSIAFIAFLAILFYLKVPSKISRLLDDRSKSIEDEINNANSILEESKTILADLEREHKLNIEKAKKILIDAESEAKNLLVNAKREVRLSIERKVKLAEDQIKASEASVIKDIKDKAVDQSILLAEATLLKTAKTKMKDSEINKSLEEIESGLKRL